MLRRTPKVLTPLTLLAAAALLGGALVTTSTVTAPPAQADDSMRVLPDQWTATSPRQTKGFRIYIVGDWTATPNADWVTIDRTSGTDYMWVYVTLAAETKGVPRATTITFRTASEPVQTLELPIRQAAGTYIPTLDVTPSSATVSATGATQTFTIDSDTAWSAETNAPEWLTVSPAAGTNAGTVTVTAAENRTNQARTAQLKLATTDGKVTRQVTLTQEAGLTPTIALDSKSWYFAATGEAHEVRVTSNVSWTVAKTPSWITASPTEGGPGETVVTLTAAAYSGVTSHGGPVTFTTTVYSPVASAHFTAYQDAGASPALSVDPTALNIPATAGSPTLAVTSNCHWTAKETVAWLSLSATSGGGDGTLTVTATANTSTVARSATITLKTDETPVVTTTVTVTQAGKVNPTLAITPTTWSPAAAGATTDLSVTSNGDWSLTSGAVAWLTVDGSPGTGDATVRLTATENPTTAARSTTLVFKTANTPTRTVSVTVRQPGSPPTLTLSQQVFIARNAGGSLDITLRSTSAWKATTTYTVGSATDWATVSPASGAAPGGTITLTAAPNPDGGWRVARVVVKSTTNAALTQDLYIIQGQG